MANGISKAQQDLIDCYVQGDLRVRLDMILSWDISPYQKQMVLTLLADVIVSAQALLV